MAESNALHQGFPQESQHDQAEPLIDWPQQLARHCDWMRRLLRCRIPDSQAVDDCMQEVALAVVKQNNKPSDVEKIPAWLYRLVVRQAVNFHRKHGRQRHLLNAYQNGLQQHAMQAPDPLDWLLEAEQHERVQQALQSLRPADREILTLKYGEQWSYKEISERLGVSENTVEYRLVRAKKQLRRLLSQV